MEPDGVTRAPIHAEKKNEGRAAEGAWMGHAKRDPPLTAAPPFLN